MPKAEDEHGNDEGEIAPPGLAADGSEREKEEVANPEGERHVPARPEHGGRGGEIGAVEIFVQLKAEEAGSANHHVGPAAEAEVELEAVAEDEEPDVEGGEVRGRIVEEGVDAGAGVEAAGHEDAKGGHHAADGEAADAGAQIFLIDGPVLPKLRQHAGHAANGALQHGRPEGHVEAELEESGVEILFAVNFEQITEGFEGPEGDANGKKNTLESGKRRAIGCGGAEQRKILKHAEEHDVGEEANPETRGRNLLFQPFAEGVVHERTENENDDQPRSPAVIKGPTGDEVKRLASFVGAEAHGHKPHEEQGNTVDKEFFSHG